MVKISREQKDFLVENGYLKLEKGRYPELTISSREKKSKRKRYYVPETRKILNGLEKFQRSITKK